jgi:hypothetical protein
MAKKRGDPLTIDQLADVARKALDNSIELSTSARVRVSDSRWRGVREVHDRSGGRRGAAW